jgi:hypothetical protein
MRKEVILAIILGLLLGTVIVVGYYRTNLPKQSPITSSVEPVPSTSPNSSAELLTLNEPQDGDIFVSPVATISGTTLPEARLVIISGDQQLFVKPSASGFFTQEISLNGGVNQITITAVIPSGQRADKSINLVFTSELNYENK